MKIQRQMSCSQSSLSLTITMMDLTSADTQFPLFLTSIDFVLLLI